LKAHRDRLGLTQQEVADALLALAWEHDHEKLGVDAAMVSKWERGQKRPRKLYRLLLCRLYDTTEEQLGLRQAHQPAAEVKGTDLLQDVARLQDQLAVVLLADDKATQSDHHVATRREVVAALAMLTSAVVAGRVAEKTGWCMEALSYEATAAQVTHVHRCYQAVQYREVAGWLPALVESVDALVAEGPQDRRHEALKLQCSVSIAAAKLATKVGDASAAWRAANSAATSALQADDPFGQAAAPYQLACALLESGRREEAEQVAAESGEAITDTDPRSLSWRGSLMLISSIVAARCQDRPGADHRLGHAQRLAERLGVDANIGWTAFGPTNVLIHRMSAAIALEEPRTVLTAAEQIDIGSVPSGLRGRQAQFHLDSAWAHVRLNNDPFALIHLLDAERVAPQLVHRNPTAHGLIQDLLSRERRMRVPGLRGLAQRAGALA
ncbi:MAG: putative transcription factor, like protein, partial [Actinobacteria bacterium]|nr:putative transcription factor, like protein [Actinomycetota bacterium]